MDTRTGRIYMEEAMSKMSAEKRSFMVPIPEDQEQAVRGMNRQQRRAWASQQRKKT